MVFEDFDAHVNGNWLAMVWRLPPQTKAFRLGRADCADLQCIRGMALEGSEDVQPFRRTARLGGRGAGS